MLVAIALLGAATVMAKDLRVAIFKVSQMHCENCVKKVKENIRFEKGVKAIATDLETKLVTVTYDAEKNTADKIAAGFGKFGYKAEFVSETKKAEEKQ
jgi:copper chaperone CopZ